MWETIVDESLGPLDRVDQVKATLRSSHAIHRTKSAILRSRSRSLFGRYQGALMRSNSFPPPGVRSTQHLAKPMDAFVSNVEGSLIDALPPDTTPTTSSRFEIEFVKKSFEAIAVDLHRTVPRHAQQNKTLLIARGQSFSPNCHEVDPLSSRGLLVSLRSVLEAWVVYRPDIGYVQGMAYIAATLLFTMDEFSAFVCLSNLLCNDTIYNFYKFDLMYIKTYNKIFDLLLCKYFPKIYAKLYHSSFTSDVFLIEWWFTLFTRSLPPAILYRVWDHYLIDGDIVLFQTALGIVKHWQPSLEQLPMDEGLLLLTSGINNFELESKVRKKPSI
eukprot:Protomagalhaensia_sp_Gyna_25__5684@NODE_807_length_2574_cov_10_987771_g635_i0_p1_GENE_NODE_807_length_2574_cov_10_987771_g635_i0NODE_807_length_2574_cov_10_987771_g635_i0_p1_ORF_typecomplete_len329_score33_52RabGAPTBC/PF00566_18/9_9e42_NODE_807_length_2574_cov_10_987771_g635_i06961682